MAKKLDSRPRYIKELTRSVEFMGYRVTESGVVTNSKGRLVKPKFYFRNKKIDYVFIDVTYNGVKKRISYHRFIYMAWDREFADKNDPNLVVTTIGRRFDYRLSNLRVITRSEHTAELAKQNTKYNHDEVRQIVESYHTVKDYMSKTTFAKRVQVSVPTLNEYIRRCQHDD